MSDTIEEQLERAVAEWRAGPHRGCELVEPLDPSRDHIVGDPAAPIAVVEYGGYGYATGSRHDRSLRAPLRQPLIEGRICFALRHFPVVDVSGHAVLAAQAVEAADRQGRFWDLHEAISIWIAEASSAEPLGRGTIVALARGLGIDVERLREDMERSSVGARILHDFGTGMRSGVNGTPTFFVAGIRQIVDRQEELLMRVEKALAGDLAALWPPVRAPVDQRSLPNAHCATQ